MPQRRAHWHNASYMDWMKVLWTIDLEPTTKLVGAAIAHHADYKTGKNAHPGTELLMRRTGIKSDKTIRTHLAILRDDMGMLSRQFEGAKAGRRGLADMYWLALHNAVRNMAGVELCKCTSK